MKISVVGCGYLGAVHAATLAEMGHNVVGIDTDEFRVAALAAGRAPFHEPGLPGLLERHVASGTLMFSTDMSLVADADVHFICVGTPQSKTGPEADLTHVYSAAAGIAAVARPGSLVVGKSTVPVGTVAALGDFLRDMAPEAGLRLAWNPEFLRQGSAVQDSLSPDRLVYGCEGHDAEEAARLLDSVYAGLLEQRIPRVICNFASAELIKGAANAFLATKVSFINSVARLCEEAGADIEQISLAMGLDPRIGTRYLGAGLGFGGGCLPKDIRSLRTQAEFSGVAELVSWMDLVDQVNTGQRSRSVDQAARLLGGSVSGRRVVVLGASFKPDTDDIRDSPAMDLALQLEAAGADVTVTDPQALESVGLRFPQVKIMHSLQGALAGAELVVLATEWAEYRLINPLWAAAQVAVRRVLDTRNALDAESWTAAGWHYQGLGRTASLTPGSPTPGVRVL